MAWKVLREEHPHFVVQGNAGEFKIHSGSLSPASLTRMRAMCSGGKVAKMDEGGAVKPGKPVGYDTTPVKIDPEVGGETPSPTELEDVRNAEQNREAVHPTPVGQRISQALESIQDPAYVERQHQEQFAQQGAAQPAASSGVPPNLARAPEQASAAPSPGAGGPAPLPPLPPEADWNKAQSQLNEALKQGTAGAETQARAETEKQAGLTDAYQQFVQGGRDLEQKRLDDTKAAQGQIDRVMQDIEASKIDPRHFWTNKSIGEKAMAGIGLILSGIGAGLTHGPNMAAQFIQKQIDADIDAQKANLGKKETVLGFMFKKYGNVQDAAAAARAYLTASLAGQVGLAGARAGSQQALAAAQILKAQLGMQALGAQAQIIQGRHQDAMQRYQLNFQRWAMQNYGGAAAEPGFIPSGTNPPIPTEVSLKGFSELNKAQGEMRVNLPELGEGSHTYAPPKVAEEVNKTLPEFLTMEKQLGIIQQIGKQHSLMINSPVPNSDKAKFMVAQDALNLSMNKLMALQRFTHEEQKLYGPMMANPSKFLFGQTGEANVKALRELIQSKRVGEYQRLGIKMGPRPKETPIVKKEE